LLLSACSKPSAHYRANATVYIPEIRDDALSWRPGPYVATLAGARLVLDGPPAHHADLAIARSVMRVNPRLAPGDALLLAAATVQAARAIGIEPEFLAATLLQESAYDPRAQSSAGAIGLGQFMPDTAASAGVDPFDPFDSIRGAAMLLSGYVHDYTVQYRDPYAAALAAYNAGPGAVRAFHGIPPYPETRQYIADVSERWARIVMDEAE